jgi:hypothetical protein
MQETAVLRKYSDWAERGMGRGRGKGRVNIFLFSSPHSAV